MVNQSEKPSNNKENKISFTEKEIISFWEKNKIFQKSLSQNKNNSPFVFYEGPPSANGLPGLHHIITRSFKDVVCRYKTMAGFYVPRQAGWDTHGLPVELQVEKELGLKNKKDIENLIPGDINASIKLFNKHCRESVWHYQNAWEKATARMGYWLNLKDPYITYDPKYIESLWHIFSTADKKNLIYEGHKIIPYCIRCGTGLSSHEVAQGYKTVTGNSVFIKFKLNSKQTIGKTQTANNTFLLAWTTTPWTLPGNVALAVGPKFKYSLIKSNTGENIIIASKLWNKKILPGILIKEISGRDLIGLSYKPLFKIKELENEKSHQVYPADFVTVKDGTGIVHTAVMYGEDDFILGSKIGLPKTHTVKEDGLFADFVPAGLAHAHIQNQKTTATILDYLHQQKLLLATTPHEHEYPHCWRCDTPIIYYARSSWFIKMSALRKELTANNSQVNWIPNHLKNGRFGKWIAEAKDWAISRERYWATPIPVWQCQSCPRQEVIDSLKELSQKTIYQNNRLFFMRHGEAKSNVKNTLSSYPEKFTNDLTPKGKKEVLAAIAKIKKLKIDLIISSDILRTKTTAKIISDQLNLSHEIDSRLRETDFGPLNGKPVKEYWRLIQSPDFNENNKHIETSDSVTTRTITALKDINNRHQNKNILIISHQDPIQNALTALFLNQKKSPKQKTIPTAGLTEIKLPSLPINDLGEIDLHRPFIDEIKLKCPDCQNPMTRIKEVMDVWFDSGAMPFASKHYPFSNQKLIAENKTFPADYICEAVDQTRGWFYTLLAISTLMSKGPAYKNVISLEHIRDKHGRKMSKSKGNVIDPWEMFKQYGADSVRWNFFTINDPGEPKNFDEADLKKVNQNVFNILLNSSLYWQTYSPSKKPASSSSHILNRWLNIRSQETILKTTIALESYDIKSAANHISDLINDLSRWFIRRSRERFQNPNQIQDLNSASLTLYHTLLTISKLIAPFSPFTAEKTYQELNKKWRSLDKKTSVHLAAWPKSKKLSASDLKLLKQMGLVRSLSSLALAQRADLEIKIRQPLSQGSISTNDLRLLGPRLISILKEEINVKSIISDSKLKPGQIFLNPNLTPILINEGLIREIIRSIQSLRAEAGLKPGQKANLLFQTDSDKISSLFKQAETQIKKSCSLKSISSTSIKLKHSKEIILSPSEPPLILHI